MKQPRFEVGHKFISRSDRKRKRVSTVTDIHTVTNLAGEVVEIIYITTHDRLGQAVSGKCLDTTIAMGETI